MFRKGRLSPVEFTRFLLERIARENPRLNAFLTVGPELALRQAARAESELCLPARRKSRRDRGPLHGIPLSLKDNIFTQGLRTTGGSAILRDFLPPYDAPVVSTLKKAGAVILGKTNLHEFAYGVTTENPHFGPARNPWDLRRTPGGSSGGSAAAVAAGLSTGSIGTDTGGSVRIPAALCGVVGLKPGAGRVDPAGVIPLSPTLDVVGPLARTVEDAALLLQAIWRNSGTASLLLHSRKLSPRARLARLGIPRDYLEGTLEPQVEQQFEKALSRLKKGGARILSIRLPRLRETEEAGNRIAWAEATHYHQQAGWFPARAGDYGVDVRKRLEMGLEVSAVDYLKALDEQRKFVESIRTLFSLEELDALVLPTTPIAAPLVGEDSVAVCGVRTATRALLLRLNRPANLAGLPAISVPAGFTREGLPVGLQFLVARGDEPLLIALAHNFEQNTPPLRPPDPSSLPSPI